MTSHLPRYLPHPFSKSSLALTVPGAVGGVACVIVYSTDTYTAQVSFSDIKLFIQEKVIPDACADKLSTRQSVSRCCLEFLGHY
jgi:hypothetical protein